MNRQIFFVSIPRTGTRSVRAALGDNLTIWADHATASAIRNVTGQGQWGAAFKFGFVRNPFDRLVSWFSLCRGAFPEYGTDFHDWVSRGMPHHWGKPTSAIFTKDPFSLCGYLHDEAGHLMVDFVGRYENFGADLQRIAALLGRKLTSIPHLNASGRSKDYRTYYDAKTRLLVEKRTANDLAAFDYKF